MIKTNQMDSAFSFFEKYITYKNTVFPKVRFFHIILSVGEFNTSGLTWYSKLTETYSPLATQNRSQQNLF